MVLPKEIVLQHQMFGRTQENIQIVIVVSDGQQTYMKYIPMKFQTYNLESGKQF